MIYKGNKKVVKIYKGETEIKKIYKGDNLVFASEDDVLHIEFFDTSAEADRIYNELCSSTQATSSSVMLDLNQNGKTYAFANARNNCLKSVKNYQNNCTTLEFFNSFYNSQKLETVIFSDKFTLHNISRLNMTFYNCASLVDLDLSTFHTENIINYRKMFSGCSKLVNLNLTNFIIKDGININNCQGMFLNCNKLKTIKCQESFYNWCTTNKTTLALYGRYNYIDWNIMNADGTLNRVIRGEIEID